MELEEKLAAFAATRMPRAADLRVDSVQRIFGGASRETYRFLLTWRDEGSERSRRLIVRRDPAGSLIETDRAVEFGAYRAFYGSAVPVPEALWLEEDPRWLGAPFFVMEEIAGFESSPQAIVAPPYAEHASRLARRKWTILGEIARMDPRALGLDRVMVEARPEECAERELVYWESKLDEDELCPQPIIRAVIRWLRRNPPPPAQKVSVVHGDFRTGNFLFDAAGEIHAVLDWEMAHMGDPLEDLAWSINPVWRWAKDERAGGLAPRTEAIRLWEAASGLRADPAALRWWELLSSVKGQAIWVSGGREFTSGKNQDPILALSSWLMGNSQDRAALLALGYVS